MSPLRNTHDACSPECADCPIRSACSTADAGQLIERLKSEYSDVLAIMVSAVIETSDLAALVNTVAAVFGAGYIARMLDEHTTGTLPDTDTSPALKSEQSDLDLSLWGECFSDSD